MARTLLFATIAISLIVPFATADAASHQKKNRQHKAPAKAVQQQYAWPWQAPADPRRRGPPWAMPNECYNDEGYGRWTPCVSRPF